MKEDIKYMRRAFALAGRGYTSPNPMVGCVLVKKNRIVGEGYHLRSGKPHAEIEALKKAGKKARGSTMYVTLEPCCHVGRTPPCTDAIIEAGVTNVVAAMYDPHIKVSGKGVKKLKRAGLKVSVGLLDREAEKLNEAYLTYIKSKRPYVVLKMAESLDGRIARERGARTQITGKEARRFVNVLRSRVDAIMVGAGTVLVDDPKLTSRIRGGRDPLRVVLDTDLKIPLTSKVLADGRCVVVTSLRKNPKRSRLEKLGATVLTVKQKNGLLDLRDVIKKLGKMGAASILIEGGGKISASALSAGIVDRVLFFISPQIFGGADAPRPVDGPLKKPIKLKDVSVEKIGDDVLVTGRI